MQILIVLNKNGELVRQIPPAFNLDGLYASAAKYACCEEIPTAYAQQAIWEALKKEGYSIKYLFLQKEDLKL